jgi:hypothetical protein
MLLGCRSGTSYDQAIQTQTPLYDTQNQDLFQSIPTPLNTNELARRSTGIEVGVAYGRVLEVEYLSDSSIEDLLFFYDMELDKLGWEVLSRSEEELERTKVSDVIYVNNNACLRIFNLTTLTTPTLIEKTTFSMFVWHDFFEQTFSIPTPSGVNLCIDGDSSCARCPPLNY